MYFLQSLLEKINNTKAGPVHGNGWSSQNQVKRETCVLSDSNRISDAAQHQVAEGKPHEYS